MVNKLYCNPLLLLVQESIIQLMISGLLFYNQPNALMKISELVNWLSFNSSSMFAMLCFILCSMFLTVSLLVIFLKEETLSKPSVFNRIGHTYQDLDLKRGMLYLLIYFFRRLVIVYLALFFTTFLGMQILFQLYINLFVMIYVGNVRPFKTAKMNRDELVNEGLIYLLTIILTVFTDFCPLAESRYSIGWGYVALNVINIAYRVSGVIKAAVRRLRLYYIKYKIRYGDRFKLP